MESSSRSVMVGSLLIFGDPIIPQKPIVCNKFCERNTDDLNQLKTEDDYKAAYEVFNHLMERAWEYGITRRYCKTMSEKYDAMVNDNNQEIYNHAHENASD